MAQIVWFRRDLRSHDHHALYEAQKHGAVIGVFIFDPNILKDFPQDHPALNFLLNAVSELKVQLSKLNIPLVVMYDQPIEAFSKLISHSNTYDVCIKGVYVNEDYEANAIARDAQVKKHLAKLNLEFVQCKDQVIFHKNEIVKQDGKPYTIFTPYKNVWLKCFGLEDTFPFVIHPQIAFSQAVLNSLQILSDNQKVLDSNASKKISQNSLISRDDFVSIDAAHIALKNFQNKIASYHENRDFPALDASSRLSHHLRFGTLSIRECVLITQEEPVSKGSATWLNELIWREFYQQFLWHFPSTAYESFKEAYRTLPFENNSLYFERWCQGKTGYPIIDAAMRQLNQTGFMHNRLRMIVASFLCKDLLIDWRWGAQYFKEKLIDYDLASNAGGWQWSASTGCDAQPYFRIFNPILQSQRFDKEGHFIRQYVPELYLFNAKDIHFPTNAKQLPINFVLGRDYPHPIVDHVIQRKYALDMYSLLPK